MKLTDLYEEWELDLYEMANLGTRNTGIPNIVIWVGADPKRHAMRIKVSNVANKWSDDNFTIMLPTLDVIGNINKQLITGPILSDIKSWIKLNIQTLIDYEDGKIHITNDFLDRLVQI